MDQSCVLNTTSSCNALAEAFFVHSFIIVRMPRVGPPFRSSKGSAAALLRPKSLGVDRAAN